MLNTQSKSKAKMSEWAQLSIAVQTAQMSYLAMIREHQITNPVLAAPRQMEEKLA